MQDRGAELKYSVFASLRDLGWIPSRSLNGTPATVPGPREWAGVSSRPSQSPSFGPRVVPLAALHVVEVRRQYQILVLFTATAGVHLRWRQRRCEPRRGASHCASNCCDRARERRLARGIYSASPASDLSSETQHFTLGSTFAPLPAERANGDALQLQLTGDTAT